MTAILEPEVGQLSLMQATLHGSSAFTTLEELNEHIKHTPNEFAVVLGPSVPVSDATAFAQWARIHRPDLGVILLRQRIDNDVLASALRSGMREVVEARDLAGLTTAVQRARSVATAIAQTLEGEAQAAADAALAELEAAAAAARAAADAPKGKVLTVFSTKGGVGKSLVATNLAVILADSGKRTCLVDLDVNNGDVAIMLQLTPTRSINDLVAFSGIIDDGAVSSMLTPQSDHLSVIAAPVHIDSPDKASSEDVGKLLEALKASFDFIVVDTSGVFDDHALTALDRSDRIILVGTLDIPALKGLKLAVSTLDLLNFPRDTWSFVLNRADGKVGLTVEEFESTLGVQADCSLESSREVLAAVNRGEALVRAYPSHPNSRALSAFARQLVGETRSPEVPSQGTPAARKSTASRLRLRRA